MTAFYDSSNAINQDFLHAPSGVTWVGSTLQQTPDSAYAHAHNPINVPDNFQYFNESGALRLSGLPEHVEITVKFKLYLIGDVSPSEEMIDPEDPDNTELFASGGGGPGFTIAGKNGSLSADFSVSGGWDMGADPMLHPTHPVYGDPTPSGNDSEILTSAAGSITHGSSYFGQGNGLGYDLYRRDRNAPEASFGQNHTDNLWYACDILFQDAVYDVTFTYADHSPTSEITFTADNINAYFGIDDVEVTLKTAAKCTNCQNGAGMPDPPRAGAGFASVRYGGDTVIGPGDKSGNGWWSGGARLYEAVDGSIAAYDVNSLLRHFKFDGSTYTYDDGDGAPWKLEYIDGEFVMTDPKKNKTFFYDFSLTDSTALLNGRFKSFIDTKGNGLSVPSGGYDSANDYRITSLISTSTVGSHTVVNETTTSYTLDGKVSGITATVKIDSGTTNTMNTVAYFYDDDSRVYKADSTTYFGGSSSSDSYYYRYYSNSTTNAYQGGLMMAFGPDALARLTAEQVDGGHSLASLSDATVKPYADEFYTYAASGGELGGLPFGPAAITRRGVTFSDAEEFNPDATDGYNYWSYKTETILPSGGRVVTYKNYLDQPMLVEELDGTTVKSLTYYLYGETGGAAGQVVLVAHSAAFVLFNGDYFDPTQLDLGLSSGHSDYLSDSRGLFELTAYGDSRAGTVTLGDVPAYVKSTSVRQGESTSTANTVTLVSAMRYLGPVDGAYQIGELKEYPTTNGTNPRTTTYSYTYAGTTSHMESMTTTLPTVAATQNGSGTASVVATAFDALGRTQWTKDAGGYLTYTEYDPGSGAVVKTISDVNTSMTDNFYDRPTGWVSPDTTSALNLITTYTVDWQGRTTSVTDPKGNKTYTVYLDSNHEVRTYQGWDSTNKMTTGPIMVSRSDPANGFTESLTYTWTGTGGNALPVSSGAPTGEESWTSGSYAQILSLSRSYSNASGQVTRSDSYFNLAGMTYSTATFIGTLNTNYYKTTYGYDAGGNLVQTVNPNSAITITTHDALARALATYIGTDDSPSTDLNGAGGSPDFNDFLFGIKNDPFAAVTGVNMTLVSLNQYDYDGIGDGNLTRSTIYPSATAPRATQYLYDWRNRLVTTKAGVLTALPSGWANNNIGSPTYTGKASSDGATFIVTGGGTGLAGTADKVNFVSRSVSGNTTLIARVAGLTNTGGGDQAGVMIRDSTGSGAMFAAVTATANGVVFAWRTTTSGAMATPVSVSTVTGPVWVKLVRSSNSFNAYYKVEEWDSWTAIGTTQSISMTSSPLAGLVVTAGNNAKLTTARFDHVTAGGTTVATSLYETDAVHRPLAVNSFDNLGEVLVSSRYDGDGTDMVDADGDGLPDDLSSSKLRARSASAYDEQGRVFESTTYSVNPTAGTYSTASTLTLVSGLWYDLRGNTIASHSSGGPMTKMAYDGVGRTTASYVTDGGAVNNTSSAGTILSTRAAAGTVANDVVLQQTEYTYDANSNVTMTTSRQRFDVNSTTMGMLTLPTATASDGHAARVSYLLNYYDAAKRLTDSVNVGTNGGSLSGTAGTGHGLNLISGVPSTIPSRTDSAYTVLITSYTYNSAGQVSLVMDPKGIKAATEYDALGRTTKTIANYGDGTPGNGSDASDDHTTLYTYDGANHVLTLTADMPSGQHDQVTQYVYDLYGNVVLVKYPNKSTGAASNNMSDQISYTYNALGEMLSKTSQNGVGHAYAYDVLGRQTSDAASFSVPAVDGSFESEGGLYDLGIGYSGNAGVMDEEGLGGGHAAYIEPGGTVSPFVSPEHGGWYAVSFYARVYDGEYGDPLVITSDDGQVNQTVSLTTTYTLYTVPMFVVAPGDFVVNFSVDSPGSGENSRIFIDDVRFVHADDRIGTTYNTQGLVSQISSYDEDGTVVNQVQREYNGFGQLTQEYQAHYGTVATGSTPSILYTYAPGDLDKYRSRLISMTYPSGKVLSYNYGTSNGLNDVISRLENLAETGQTLESYSYLGLGTVVKRAHAQNSVDLTFIGSTTADAGDNYVGLDRFGRVVDQRWATTGGTDLDRYQYAYDQNSNVLTKTNTLSGGLSETYTYDGLNRLTGADRSTGTANDQLWTLDALGNMTTVTTNGTPVSRTHNDANQLMSVGGSSLAYDDDGNTTTDDQGNTLVYDSWNRLIAVRSGSTTIRSYAYDALGRRITETSGGTGVDLYFSAQGQVLEERTTYFTATVLSQNVWSPVYVNALLLRDRDSDNDGSHTLDQRTYQFHDANYNITAQAGTSGTVLQRESYTAYGIVAFMTSGWSSTTDGYATVYTYQGGRTDVALGQIIFNARVYSVTMARWYQADPAGYVDGLSDRAFVAGNPIKYLDPRGTEVTISGLEYVGNVALDEFGADYRLQATYAGVPENAILYQENDAVVTVLACDGSGVGLRDHIVDMVPYTNRAVDKISDRTTNEAFVMGAIKAMESKGTKAVAYEIVSAHRQTLATGGDVLERNMWVAYDPNVNVGAAGPRTGQQIYTRQQLAWDDFRTTLYDLGPLINKSIKDSNGILQEDLRPTGVLFSFLRGTIVSGKIQDGKIVSYFAKINFDFESPTSNNLKKKLDTEIRK